MVTVSVILYKASEKEGRHWAIHFEIASTKGKTRHYLHHATGETHSFEYTKEEKKYDPTTSSRFFKEIHVTDALDDVDEAETVMQNVEIDNENPTWGCQDWVMDALEALKDAGLIPEQECDNSLDELREWSGFNDESD